MSIAKELELKNVNILGETFNEENFMNLCLWE